VDFIHVAELLVANVKM